MGFAMIQFFKSSRDQASWEVAFEKFFIATLDRFEKLEAKIDQVAIHNKNLEMQLGQLASFSRNKTQGNLPNKIKVNPKEHCKAITLRSGKQVNQSIGKEIMKDKEDEADKKRKIGEQIKEEYDRKEEKHHPPIKPCVPLIPFPQRLKQNRLDKKFEKFLYVFWKLHIKIRFAYALDQMPSYARFLKEIFSNKRKLKEYASIVLTKEYSAIIQNKLPLKLKDSKSFSIPYVISNVNFKKGLCDLGASVSLMPLFMRKRLRLGKLKPITIFLQWANKYVKYPIGALENA